MHATFSIKISVPDLDASEINEGTYKSTLTFITTAGIVTVPVEVSGLAAPA